MAAARKFYKKKTVPHPIKSDKTAMSPVVTVRISDEEKERIDLIMRNLNIKRYSDMMRMALQMAQQQKFPVLHQVNSL
jgi:antitoxin component of RelBE/YafQ-DinJ toxin-antitoxin module